MKENEINRNYNPTEGLSFAGSKALEVAINVANGFNVFETALVKEKLTMFDVVINELDGYNRYSVALRPYSNTPFTVVTEETTRGLEINAAFMRQEGTVGVKAFTKICETDGKFSVGGVNVIEFYRNGAELMIMFPNVNRKGYIDVIDSRLFTECAPEGFTPIPKRELYRVFFEGKGIENQGGKNYDYEKEANEMLKGYKPDDFINLILNGDIWRKMKFSTT